MYKLILLVLLLGGCATPPVIITEVKEAQLFHPQIPSPVVCGDLSNYVIIDGRVTQKYRDNVQLRSCIVHVLEYLAKTQAVMCSYRKELNEAVCLKPDLSKK